MKLMVKYASAPKKQKKKKMLIQKPNYIICKI